MLNDGQKTLPDIFLTITIPRGRFVGFAGSPNTAVIVESTGLTFSEIMFHPASSVRGRLAHVEKLQTGDHGPAPSAFAALTRQ